MRNKMFGFIMQDFALIENYTVYQNIQIPLIYNHEKRNGENDRRRISELLESFHFSGKENQIVSTLSGGERQRAALIRAIVNNPEIIIADEHTSAFDAKNSEYIIGEIKKFNDQGKAIIMVTHDDKTAAAAKRTMFLNSGILSDSGD